MKYKKSIILEKGREKLARNHNPWIFSGAVKTINGNVEDGDVVAVLAIDGSFIAWGHYNSKSGIAIRLLEWDVSVMPDTNWLRAKVSDAFKMRRNLINESNNIYRLIFSESDMMPGVICDVFGDIAVLAVSTPGFDNWKNELAEIILQTVKLNAVYEKSDGDGRKIEGLVESSGLITGELGSTKFTAYENGFRYEIDVTGQKTGFYADQRDNRLYFGEVAHGEVLDMCSFSGAFSIHALKNGADHATLCDISREAQFLIDRNMEQNSIDRSKYTFIQGDAFEVLRSMASTGKKFDSIVLDPPKLVPSNKYLEKGLKAYKDLNFNALRLLRDGGILATFSCSGAVSMADFKSAVAFAAKDANKELRILRHLHQSPDHPVRVSAPETEYLKGLLIRG